MMRCGKQRQAGWPSRGEAASGAIASRRLDWGRGAVRGRVAVLLRSAEAKPASNKSVCASICIWDGGLVG